MTDKALAAYDLDPLATIEMRSWFMGELESISVAADE